MKILLYCQPETIVSGDIRLKRMFATVLAWGGVNLVSGVVESYRRKRPIFNATNGLASEPLKIKPSCRKILRQKYLWIVADVL